MTPQVFTLIRCFDRVLLVVFLSCWTGAAIAGEGGKYIDPKQSPNTIPVPTRDVATDAEVNPNITPPIAKEAPQGERGAKVPEFLVRPGYRVTLAAENLAEARFMQFDDKGTLYVSQPNAGSIVALRDKDGDGVYETSTRFVTGKKRAHGMQWRNGWLFFTTSQGIYKARDTKGDGKADQVLAVVPEESLPGGGGHWWRSILVTDDSLYSAVGDSGNANEHTKDDRTKIWRFDFPAEKQNSTAEDPPLDPADKHLWCTGVRNTEKLLIRPGTSEIWGCDHGSDNYGGKLGEKKGEQPITDFQPPCEFNRYVEGGFYGHPYVIGMKLPRYEFADRKDILELADKTIPPMWAFGAHWAPNGWCWVQKDYFAGHKGDAIVTFHGSWNSTTKVGYQVDRLMFDRWTGRPCGMQMIVGTLTADNKTELARPCDAVEAPDGTILFSCDKTKRIYRIGKTGGLAQNGALGVKPGVWWVRFFRRAGWNILEHSGRFGNIPEHGKTRSARSREGREGWGGVGFVFSSGVGAGQNRTFSGRTGRPRTGAECAVARPEGGPGARRKGRVVVRRCESPISPPVQVECRKYHEEVKKNRRYDLHRCVRSGLILGAGGWGWR